ncbi:MAG: hypothetical protein J5979_05220 [Lachnospiraceae bacterium]|nr:hypothetical protein [Lachnospiraceae bacterium]
MGDRYVATVRFHTEGVEAELYQKLLDGKRDSGLSVPDYIKRILAEHFANKDRQDNQKELLEQFRADFLTDMERVIRNCIKNCGVSSGDIQVTDAILADRQDSTELPAPSEEIPEGALDFLNE